MKRGRSTGNMTKPEREWVNTVKRLGCLCCIARGYEHDPDGTVVEAHHLLSGGIRIGHGASVGLCAWHHRGALIVAGWNHGTHRRLLGPALSEGSVPFHAAFGDDESLMKQQNALIAKHTRRAA